MKFIAKATSQEEFEQWVETVRKSPLSLTLSEYYELAKQSQNNPVAYYASAEEKLYNTVIMKFMAPMKEMSSSPVMDMSAMESAGVN